MPREPMDFFIVPFSAGGKHGKLRESFGLRNACR
jgi:hypothetical protein